MYISRSKRLSDLFFISPNRSTSQNQFKPQYPRKLIQCTTSRESESVTQEHIENEHSQRCFSVWGRPKGTGTRGRLQECTQFWKMTQVWQCGITIVLFYDTQTEERLKCQWCMCLTCCDEISHHAIAGRPTRRTLTQGMDTGPLK